MAWMCILLLSQLLEEAKHKTSQNTTLDIMQWYKPYASVLLDLWNSFVMISVSYNTYAHNPCK